MMLWEAIREGCKINKQLRYGTIRKTGKTIEACALAAAALGYGMTYEQILNEGSHIGDKLSGNSPEPRFKCPEGCLPESFRRETQLVMHLNDSHGWTREEIADWLEAEDAYA